MIDVFGADLPSFQAWLRPNAYVVLYDPMPRNDKEMLLRATLSRSDGALLA